MKDKRFFFAGINRGDNCGIHVIYSGTVGAAREASIKVRSSSFELLAKCKPVAFLCLSVDKLQDWSWLYACSIAASDMCSVGRPSHGLLPR